MKLFAAIAAIATLLISGCGTLPDQIAAKVDVLSAKVSTPTVDTLGASAAPAVPELAQQSEVNAHLDNAIAIATAGNDPAGVQCWSALKSWVATLPLNQQGAAAELVLPAAIGPSGVVEVARLKAKYIQAQVGAVQAKIAVIRATINAGLPDPVVQGCAVVVSDARLLAAKIIALAGLGAGAVQVAPMLPAINAGLVALP